MITMRMAESLAMVEGNATGEIARDYYIAMRKIVGLAIEWESIREPENKRYNLMSKEIVSENKKRRIFAKKMRVCLENYLDS